MGSAWQFRLGKEKEIAFLRHEQRKQKYEELIKLVVALLARSGQSDPETAEASHDFVSALGISREQWLAANVDVSLDASDQFVTTFNEYYRGLLRHDDYYVSARRMADLFLQIRREVVLGDTKLRPQDVLATTINDIDHQRYDAAFADGFAWGRRPSRPLPASPEADQHEVDSYLTLVAPVSRALQETRDQMLSMDLGARAKDMDTKSVKADVLVARKWVVDLEEARKVLATVDVPPRAQRLQQAQVSLVEQWLEAAKLTEKAFTDHSTIVMGMALDKWAKSAPAAIEAQLVEAVLATGVPASVAEDYLQTLSTVNSDPQSQDNQELVLLNRRERREQARRAGR